MLSVEDTLVGTLTKQQGWSCRCVGCGLTSGLFVFTAWFIRSSITPFWKAINFGVYLGSMALGRQKPLNPACYAVKLRGRQTAEIRIKGLTSASRAFSERGHCIAKAYSYLAFDRGLFFPL